MGLWKKGMGDFRTRNALLLFEKKLTNHRSIFLMKWVSTLRRVDEDRLCLKHPLTTLLKNLQHIATCFKLYISSSMDSIRNEWVTAPSMEIVYFLKYTSFFLMNRWFHNAVKDPTTQIRILFRNCALLEGRFVGASSLHSWMLFSSCSFQGYPFLRASLSIG